MKRMRLRIGFSAMMAIVALAAGCSVNTNFVYKPNPPKEGARQLPLKVAVLPFEDGTESFTKRGSALSDGEYNLAKAGVSGSMSAMPPAFWGKSFADELAASGSFQSARFVYSPSEIRQDEAILVDGTLRKVVFAANLLKKPNSLLVSFRAMRMSDKKVVWEKEIGKVWEQSRDVYPGCGTGLGCAVGKVQEDWNRHLAALFAVARADLVAALASPPDAGSGSAGTGQPPALESVEQTIDKVLKGK